MDNFQSTARQLVEEGLRKYAPQQARTRRMVGEKK